MLRGSHQRDHLVTLRWDQKGYASERTMQNQRVSNPGGIHDWCGGQVLYQCATPPLYITSDRDGVQLNVI